MSDVAIDVNLMQALTDGQKISFADLIDRIDLLMKTNPSFAQNLSADSHLFYSGRVADGESWQVARDLSSRSGGIPVTVTETIANSIQ